MEALAAGRNAIGVDISALAEFVAKVKTTVFSEAELDKLKSWSVRLPNAIDIHKSTNSFTRYAELGYYKHLDHVSRWRLRKAIEQSMASAIRLGTPRLSSWPLVVLRTAQWALDGRSNSRSPPDIGRRSRSSMPRVIRRPRTQCQEEKLDDHGN